MRVSKSTVKKMSKKEGTPPPEEEGGQFFEGSLVEVSSDEDGYSGSWYEAQVVTQLPLSRKRKKGVSFVVQYMNLVQEDGSGPLTETVEYNQLRPLPPDVEEPIGLHDSVDAFVRDGWWEGVVVKVLEESKRFSILFESPSEHVLDFDRDALRHHLKWIDGYWFRTPKKTNISCVQDDQRQQQFANSPTSVTTIEEFFASECSSSPKNGGAGLSSFEKELGGLRDHGNEIAPNKAISTSTKLSSNSENEIALSQPFKKMITEGVHSLPSCTELLSEMLPYKIYKASLFGNIFENASDLQQSRATTSLRIVDLGSGNEDTSPGKDDGTANIHHREEKTTNFSSWDAYSLKGTQNAFRAKALEASQKGHVMKDGKMGMTNCSSKSNSPSVDITKLDLPDIINDPGSLQQRDEMVGTSVEIAMQAETSEFEGTDHPDIQCIADDQRQKQCATSPESSSTIDVFFPSGSSISAAIAGDECPFLEELQDSRSKNEMAPHMAISTCTNLSRIFRTDDKLRQVKKLKTGSIYTPLFCTKHPFVMLQSETLRVLFDQILQNPTELLHQPNNWLTFDQHLTNEGVSSEKSDEIAQKPTDIIIHRGSKRTTNLLSWENISLKALPSSQNSSGGEVIEASQKAYLTRDGSMEIMNVTSSSTILNPSLDIAELDLPDIISDSWILQQMDETAGTLVDTSMKDKTNEFEQRTQPVETDGQTLPFTKNSPLWEHIELMEAFRAYPQNPHFRPLEQVANLYREGIAISYMVIFASIVEEVSKLAVDASEIKVDNLMKCALFLENQGFNVDPVKSWVSQLQRTKEDQEWRLLALKEVESKIMEQDHKITKTSEELENALKDLNELEEKVTKLRAVKKQQDSEMVALKSEADSINHGIMENGIHFGDLLPASSICT